MNEIKHYLLQRNEQKQKEKVERTKKSAEE